VTPDFLRELFRHMEWADATVWRAVLVHPDAGRDGRLAEWLLHIHTVQRAFLHIWTSKPVTFPNVSDFPEISALQQWAQPYYDEARRFLATLDPAALEQPVVMPWVRHFEERLGRAFAQPTLAETVFQVTSHSTYHRGQVNARLRTLGGEPPLVDFIAWVWFGKPAPEWPAATATQAG
jgi:uncharacterized damage-inducible protein DinB